MKDSVVLDQAVVHGDTCFIDLWYPRNTPVKFIQIGLMDVRAADDIRASYDFERDGWKIEQPTVHQGSGDGPLDQCWTEVAFVSAWHPSCKDD